MSVWFHREHWPWLALLATVGAVSHAPAQQDRFRTVQEPQWFRYRLREISGGVYTEGRFEKTSFGGGSPITHNRAFVGPLLGLGLDGSVYHPNLFRFQIDGEGSYGRAYETLTGSEPRHEREFLGRFSGSADILANKPYNANLFSSYDHSFRDFDFFSRATVDSWRYGGKANYNVSSLFLSAGYAHRDEEVTGLSVDSIARENVVTFDARHERQAGSTAFGYNLTEYERGDVSSLADGTDHTFLLSDTERFGSRDQLHLYSRASYTLREGSFQDSDQITAGTTLTADHRPNLSSYYDLNYDRYEQADFQSDNYNGRAELRHQLYDSLHSTLIAQAANYEVSDEISSGYTRRFGGGFAENYSKRLTDRHRLRLINSLLVEHVMQQSIGSIVNEAHTFTESASDDRFTLNQPNVEQASIVVTDAQDVRVYLRGIDYLVQQNGPRTEIVRPFGSSIPANSTVRVDYQAAPTPEGSYQALQETFQVRVDLWDNFWGIYGRLNLFLHNAPSELRVQTLRSYTFGTDVQWRWLTAGVEYEIYDSDQSRYRSTRLFQTLTFQPEPESSLSFNFSETWTDYLDANRQEEDYRFITRFRRAMTSYLAVDLEGGVALRRGRGVDQTVATARPGVQYAYGKTSIRAGYDYEYNLFLDSEERTKHLFFLRARRVF